MHRPNLKVVQGDWVACERWLAFPRTLAVRSPFFGLDIRTVRISKNDVVKAAGLRRRTPAYVLWSALVGQLPPVPHDLEVAKSELTRLRDAHACFQGVRRPCAEDGDGDNVVAYVLKPNVVIGYKALPPAMLAVKEVIPGDLVLVAYVRLDAPVTETGPIGVLTHWQFVEADAADCMLPKGYKERYAKRLW